MAESTGRRLRVAAVAVGAAGLAVLVTTSAAGTEREAAAPAEVALTLPSERTSGPPEVPVPEQPTQDRPNLSTLTGVLEACGSDYCMDGTAVDFGPPWHLPNAEAPGDLDRDGQTGSFGEEIAGLVGTKVTLNVEYGRDGVTDVFAVDGVFLRDEIGPPPWVGGPPWAGPR